MGASSLVPSPQYSGERDRVRGRVRDRHGGPNRAARMKPLTPALSPEYRGEGVRCLPRTRGTSSLRKMLLTFHEGTHVRSTASGEIRLLRMPCFGHGFPRG